MKKTWKKIVACFLAVVLLTLNVVGIHASSVDFLIRSDITSGGDEGYDEGYDKRIANEADSWIFRTTFVWIFISAVLQSDGYVDRRTFPRSR